MITSELLADGALRGDRRALARLLSWLEDRIPGADVALARLYPHTGHAQIIGVTGAPGTGKSSLVTALTRALRERGQTVGIIAVDPTSPFTGGAILGDRIRMRDLSGDPGVFIRSMATRGTLGGLASASRDAARVLDAAGFNVVLVETVGAGQNEVAIARLAQTTLVVEAPGLGDEIQAIKAGILEIADILVVNKADMPGASQTVRALRTTIETGHPALRTRWMHHGQMLQGQSEPSQAISGWIPPIVETSAAEGTGIGLLLEQIAAHRAYLLKSDSSAAVERAQLELELVDRLRERLLERLLAALPQGAVDDAIDRVQAREEDPASAAAELIIRAAALSA